LRLRKRFFSKVFTLRKIPLLSLLAEPLALFNAEVARELGDSPRRVNVVQQLRTSHALSK
jgi:hypothetical protein